MRSLTRIRVSAAATAPSRGAISVRSSRSLPQLALVSPHPTSSSSCSVATTTSTVLSSPRLYTTSTLPRYASVVPVFGAPTGPPPEPPAAGDREAEDRVERIARRKKHVQQGQGRFWKAATVKAVDDAPTTSATPGDSAPKKHLEVTLDARPLRHPTTRAVIQIPASKALLAHALAIEWDQLRHVRQAAQSHRMPLMSLVCRAIDLDTEIRAAADGSVDTSGSLATASKSTSGSSAVASTSTAGSSADASMSTPTSEGASPEPLAGRATLIDNLLRYLDTDSLLCWAPPDDAPANSTFGSSNARDLGPPWGVITLRQLQEQTALPILAYLAAHVWPGVEVRPVLGLDASNALFPTDHPPEVRAAVRHWLWTLDGWQLAGVERATLAGKSLVTAARLVAEWSEAGAVPKPDSGARFTVDDAANAANMETAFQTAQWGEVDDTHDVDKADLRRHYGSVVLLVQ